MSFNTKYLFDIPLVSWRIHFRFPQLLATTKKKEEKKEEKKEKKRKKKKKKRRRFYIDLLEVDP